MDKIIQFLSDAGLSAWFIFALGGAAIVIIIERFNSLFMRIKLTSEEFILKLETLLLANKLEEAITLTAKYSEEPIAKVSKAVLERADRDDQSIHQAHELKLGETLAPLGRRLNYLLMIANVSTLVGLLGTISGLIMSFEAVSFADPAQKQVLLSQGISIAMNSTAIGLSVAIPVMVCYSVLNSRHSKLTETIINQSGRIVDHLTNRHYFEDNKTEAV